MWLAIHGIGTKTFTIIFTVPFEFSFLKAPFLSVTVGSRSSPLHLVFVIDKR